MILYVKGAEGHSSVLRSVAFMIGSIKARSFEDGAVSLGGEGDWRLLNGDGKIEAVGGRESAERSEGNPEIRRSPYNLNIATDLTKDVEICLSTRVETGIGGLIS